MNQELKKTLAEKYPTQFENIKYIECGDGWYNLISKLCNAIQNRIDYRLKNGQQDTNFYWSQIKEKFGGLRAYCYGADEYMRGAIDMAETMSYSICEYSGEKGRLYRKKLVEGKIVNAWIKTLSLEEAIKEGYYVSENKNEDQTLSHH
jgi:hypothetical protein